MPKHSALLVAVCSWSVAGASIDNNRQLHGLHPLQDVYHACLVDRGNKILLGFSPKGGATVATQLFFRYEGVFEKALEYNSWVHNYRTEVFNEQPNHRRVDCKDVCSDPSWVCAYVVRQPLDRVVSSYYHTMKTSIWRSWIELKEAASTRYPPLDIRGGSAVLTADNVTFSDFLGALRLRARSPQGSQPKSKSDNHFMPQSDSCTRHGIRKQGKDATGVYLLPVEALEGSLGAVGNLTGLFFDSSGLTSPHYVQKNALLLPRDAPKWSFERVRESHPAYEAFVMPGSTEARDVCFLFSDDFDIYRRGECRAWFLLFVAVSPLYLLTLPMPLLSPPSLNTRNAPACKQPWLLGLCAKCAQECAGQIARMDAVCGVQSPP